MNNFVMWISAQYFLVIIVHLLSNKTFFKFRYFVHFIVESANFFLAYLPVSTSFLMAALEQMKRGAFAAGSVRILEWKRFEAVKQNIRAQSNG